MPPPDDSTARLHPDAEESPPAGDADYEAEVREAGDYAEQIIDTLPEPLLVLSPDLRVRSANAAFYQHFQVAADETLGRKVYDLGNRQWDIPALRQLLEDVLPRDEVFTEFVVEHEFEVLGRRVMLLNGRQLDHVQMILLGIQDITERYDTEAALRRSEERLRRIVNIEGVGVLVFDDTGTVVEANDTFVRMFGYTRDEIAARSLTWRAMTPSEFVELSEEQLESLERTGRIGPYEKEYLRKDGSRSWMLFAGAALGDGTVAEYCIDISARKRAEKALRESESRYRSLSELSPDAILVNVDGRYVYANDAAARLLAAENADALVGHAPLDFVVPEYHDIVRERVRYVLEEQRPTERIEARWKRLDGSRVDVEVIAGPVEWRGEAAVQVVARDVSERKRAERALRESEEQRYRTLFDSMDEGFCIVEVLVDAAEEPVDLCFVEVNPAFERHTGIDDAVGRRMQEIAPQLETYWYEILGKVARSGESVRFERPAKELGRFLDVYAFRVGLPEQRRVAVLFTDITERKRLEDRLRRIARQLAEANRRKDQYLAMLGHELRNPLAAIRNATELMRLTELEDGRLQRAHSVLVRQSEHMSRLLDGLLEVSRIARGKVHLQVEPLDVRGVLESVVQDRSAEIAERGLELQQDLPAEPVWVEGDRVRLAQIFDNLLGNAVKFTGAPGSISVSLERDQGSARIRVRDSGAGIRPEMLDRIFEPFHQEHQDMARAEGGLGLGLALAKELVALHDGSIEAHSAGPGTGAEFEIRLPLTSTPAAQARAPERAEASPPRRVLLVEDNADAAQMLRELLELSGHQVEAVESGPEALEALRDHAADVVLCDLGLPGMSGHDVAREVRSDPALRAIPLVALTGYGQPQDRAQTTEAGFDEHLTKPVDLETLTAVLGRLGGGH